MCLVLSTSPIAARLPQGKALRSQWWQTPERPCPSSINGSSIPDSTFDRDINELINLGHAERVAQGEYLLRKSPSPNDPQKSPLGITCTPEKSPPAPHPYRGGDVGIGAGVDEVKDIAPSMSSAAAVGGYLERIEVPNFNELNAWPFPTSVTRNR